jgi:hypothetical protein
MSIMSADCYLLCRRPRCARQRGTIHDANMETSPVTIRVTGQAK